MKNKKYYVEKYISKKHLEDLKYMEEFLKTFYEKINKETIVYYGSDNKIHCVLIDKETNKIVDRFSIEEKNVFKETIYDKALGL